jgi:Ca2+/H+ antiporter, TMEM165/GDT1 family
VQVGETFVLAMLSMAGTKAKPFGPAREVAVSFAIAAAVFPIIFIGELPDKTMFASLVMSTRGNPLAVWLGAAAAFLVHVVIATTIGVALFHLVPHRVLDGVVALLFLAGAALAIREAAKEKEEEEAEAALVEKEVVSGRRMVTTAFIVIFLAEWGDLTQILTANLAAHYHSPFSVGVGAVLALWAVAGLAVIGGQSLLRFINIRTLRIVTAVALVGLAGWAAWQALR